MEVLLAMSTAQTSFGSQCCELSPVSQSRRPFRSCLGSPSKEPQIPQHVLRLVRVMFKTDSIIGSGHQKTGKDPFSSMRRHSRPRKLLALSAAASLSGLRRLASFVNSFQSGFAPTHRLPRLEVLRRHPSLFWAWFISQVRDPQRFTR